MKRMIDYKDVEDAEDKDEDAIMRLIVLGRCSGSLHGDAVYAVVVIGLYGGIHDEECVVWVTLGRWGGGGLPKGGGVGVGPLGFMLSVV